MGFDFAQPEKFIRADLAGQSKSLRAQPDPLAGHAPAFIVVIPDAEMLRKIFFSVLEVALCFGGDHA